MGRDVFLSYPTQDKDAADAVCTALERRGISVWMAPRDILPGLPWPGQIIQGIDSARSVVLIFSAAANASEQIEREVQRAVDRALKVVPFRIENVRPKDDLAYSIGNVQWLDAFAPPMEPHYDQLAKVLRQLASLPPLELGPGAPPPPPRFGRYLLAFAALALALGVAGAVWHFIGPSPTPLSRCFSKPQNESASRINYELARKSKASDKRFTWADSLAKKEESGISEVFAQDSNNNMDVIVFKLESNLGQLTLRPLDRQPGTEVVQKFQMNLHLGDEDGCGELTFDPSYETGDGWWSPNGIGNPREATLVIHAKVADNNNEGLNSSSSVVNNSPSVLSPNTNDRRIFYQKISGDLFNPLTQTQTDGIEAIVNYWNEHYRAVDVRVLAYILATAYHETDHKMQPLEEYGQGRGLPYGKPDQITGKIYYGRGLIQLTWKRYYGQMGDILGIDLVNHPELAMELPVSAAVLVEGMMRGIFGHKVTDYINSEHVDWINARKTINGLDQADAIAGYAQRFFKALQGA